MSKAGPGGLLCLLLLGVASCLEDEAHAFGSGAVQEKAKVAFSEASSSYDSFDDGIYYKLRWFGAEDGSMPIKKQPALDKESEMTGDAEAVGAAKISPPIPNVSFIS